MINYEQFINKFPTTESLENEYPVGKKFTWCDGYKYTIVGYMIDNQFKKKGDFEHLIVVKFWSKSGHVWCYRIMNTFVFYSTVELIEREMSS